ncbi:hypothetical protein D9611_005915 [Ephemerocybe angulata]|uniref:Fungal-type protein kinase domain-containing protein n=1 Tax=Ephemerocybe angulata TaxID=980116 RepID=A0A8H5CFZ5_9AGAR|nr:hypothetical protein D9611_005915 [Tulosesus angulatus]
MSPSTEKSDSSAQPAPSLASTDDLQAPDPHDESPIGPGHFIDLPKEDMALLLEAESGLLAADHNVDPGLTATPGRGDPQTPTKHAESLKPLTQNTSTPFRASSQNQTSKHEEMKTIIHAELGPKVYAVNPRWVATLYCRQAPVKKIMKFLNHKSRYSLKRWKGLPESPRLEEDLYNPLHKIISDIVREFNPSGALGVTREVLDTHETHLRHDNVAHPGTKPDISIKATGASFESPHPRRMSPSQSALGVGWSNVAAVFEVKLDVMKGSETDHLKQIAGYCRQIFIHQPNRTFVRCLQLITEEHVQLVHFDRSGVYISPFINIHKDPYTFVRLVVGLSSCDEDVLGLDTTVSWTVDPETGRKVSGLVKAPDASGALVDYEISMASPPFIRAAIRGRGTVCYRAVHPQTKAEVLIKDSWRSDTRTPESTYLKDGQEIDGVVRLLAFDDNCGETRVFRPEHAGSDFHNRIKSRIVMEHCTGRRAYRHIYESLPANSRISRCHSGDISIRNILLGDPNPERIGRRGILIDFDMAIWILRPPESIAKDPRSGSQRWQSRALLRNRKAFALEKAPGPPPADHLDDLESFFYIFCFLVGVFTGPEKEGYSRDPRVEEIFARMDVADPESAAGAKDNIVVHPFELSDWWGEPCQGLIEMYQLMVQTIEKTKGKIRNSAKTTVDEKLKQLEKLGREETGHHKTLIAAFDQALEEIKSEDLKRNANATPLAWPEDLQGETSNRPPTSPSPAERTRNRHTPIATASSITPQEGRRNLKRPSNTIPEEVLNAKRKVRNVRWTDLSDQAGAENDEEE